MSIVLSSPTDPCPCGSPQTYAACCQPYHLQQQKPATAEILMRSRYCAYALAQVEYLMRTMDVRHPQFSKNQLRWRQELLKYCQQHQFLSLTILDTQTLSDTKATVHFKAVMAPVADPDNKFGLEENSEFICKNGRWFYAKGDAKLVPVTA